jgi:hypothetical protein
MLAFQVVSAGSSVGASSVASVASSSSTSVSCPPPDRVGSAVQTYAGHTIKPHARGQQLFAAAADANVASQPDSYPYRATWSDTAVEAEIEAGIERHRKADAALLFVDANGSPVTDIEVRVEQISHAFLFGANLFVLGQLKTPELNHRYEAAFTKLFNQATVPFYWVDLEPEEGKLRFDERSAYRWRRPPTDPRARCSPRRRRRRRR